MCKHGGPTTKKKKTLQAIKLFLMDSLKGLKNELVKSPIKHQFEYLQK